MASKVLSKIYLLNKYLMESSTDNIKLIVSLMIFFRNNFHEFFVRQRRIIQLDVGIIVLNEASKLVQWSCKASRFSPEWRQDNREATFSTKFASAASMSKIFCRASHIGAEVGVFPA